MWRSRAHKIAKLLSNLPDYEVSFSFKVWFNFSSQVTIHHQSPTSEP